MPFLIKPATKVDSWPGSTVGIVDGGVIVPIWASFIYIATFAPIKYCTSLTITKAKIVTTKPMIA